jgi:hypothetical protein
MPKAAIPRLISWMAGQFIDVAQRARCSRIPNNERRLFASDCDVWRLFVAGTGLGEVLSHALL